MTDETALLLLARSKTHGPFSMNAMISQKLKRFMHEQPCWTELHDVHREALHVMALKLSRILSGQADFCDHWDDIAGYARLASEACGRRD